MSHDSLATSGSITMLDIPPRAVMNDHPLASDVRKVEQRYRLGYVENVQGELIRAIHERYEVESELAL